MSGSFEKSVKGATKIKLAPPKSKYIEHILVATHGGEHGVAEIFRALQNRLRDSTWTIVFKSLIVIHFMIREGEPDVTLKFLSTSPQRKLAINTFTEVQTQGRNIRCYAEYLHQRAISFGNTKVDYVRGGEGRLKRLTIDKGLLRETESVQDQIRALLRCDLLSDEPENEITLTAFRLLTMDLLVLYSAMNEGTISILEHYFELSRPDAERALKIYKTFAKQTDYMVRYLAIARQYQYATRLEIPKIKHAPTSLAASLEEYLHDRDFEANRRQYIDKQRTKHSKSPVAFGNPSNEARQHQSISTDTTPQPLHSKPQNQDMKGPAPDLIDFFESIEQNQQTMAQPQYTSQVAPQMQLSHPQINVTNPQADFTTNMTGYPQQQAVDASNPFFQMQVQPPQVGNTGGFYGGYSAQPSSLSTQQPLLSSIPSAPVDILSNPNQQMTFHTSTAQPIAPQSTNPFRQSMMPGSLNVSSLASNNTTSLSRQPTNPFARQNTSSPQTSSSLSTSTFQSNNITLPFQSSSSSFASQPASLQPAAQSQYLQPTPTGTNPFARNLTGSSATGQQPPQQQTISTQPSVLAPNVTGSTNPFRQSMLVNTQTGQGWQGSGQGTMGGFEQLETIPVFPRSGQPAL